jgi:CO dehydrogenase/acetyl-CoA synthase beta subunit
MNLFNDIIDELRKYITRKRLTTNIREEYVDSSISWPSAEKANIVLQTETGLELGNPRDESISFLVWTNTLSLVNDGLITLVGDEIGDISEKSKPFGKVVIIGGVDFNEENCYDRYREIELIRYDLNLRGYMIRAVPQYMREWSRISKDAIRGGFSLSTLGGALIEKYKEKDYIHSVEILFVNSSSEDIRELRSTGERVMRYINAMNKMTEELSLDCDSCEYSDVCGEVIELRAMRDSLMKKGKADDASFRTK